MNNTPLISVIMPVYNGEAFLKEAIESILNQDFTNFEFIIINDGSTDRSEQIILSYADPRIRYVKNETNIRLIKTLNKGIDLAKGKYIARMDADDISTKDRFRKQIDILRSSPNIHVVSSIAYNILEEGTVFAPPTKWYSSDAIKIISPLASLICHPAVMCRADVLKKNKYRDEVEYIHIEDAELWIRLIENGGTLHIVNEPLLYYRQNPSGVSINNRMAQAEKYINISRRILKDKYDIDISPDLLYILHFTFVNYKKGDLFKLERLISEYFEKSTLNFSNKDTLKEELNNWLRYILVASGIKGLFTLKGSNKVNTLYYLICRLKWLSTYSNVINRYFYKLRQ